MANPTPEQREEAAKCLRENIVRIYDWVSGYDIAAMIGVENYTGNKDSTDELLERLAGLIDPTCRIIYKNTSWFAHDGIHVYEWECKCSECGADLTDYCEDALGECEEKPFNYCPNCGSRVTEVCE
ncbi:hypothetical protein [Atopobium fossor]|uniref:hypothetical protein n=1 Tax=Atopobium fossor TaxID=39487 RepID=UPI00042106A4|nr:hypothetical protein [Atopobium fossor]